MNQIRVHPDRYYSQLRAASNALLNYNNFHLTKLWKNSVAPKGLQTHTDCIICSIKTGRKNERDQKMKIVVTTGVQNNRSLILAFHPLFDEQEFDDITLIKDHKRPLEQRRYQYLKHLFNRAKGDTLPLLGVGGFPMDEFYAYLAHFLVIRKLLARVPTLQC